jgi:hypothetical protein
VSASRDLSIDDPRRRQGTQSIKAKSRGLAGSKRSQAGQDPTERREAKFFRAQGADSFAVEILAWTTFFHLQLDKHCRIHVVVDPTVGPQVPRSSAPELDLIQNVKDFSRRLAKGFMT